MLKIILLVFSLSIICISAKKLPSDVELCKHEDTACITRVATSLINLNSQGRADVGIPKLEPFRINSLNINQGGASSVNLELNFKDLDVEGISKATVYRTSGFSKDPKTSKFELSARFPLLRLRGKYSAKGRILILPISGNGNADISLDNVNIDIKFKPTVTEKDGHQFLGVDKLKILVQPTKMRVLLENLFNGDPTLGPQMNTFINENWKSVWDELEPGINGALVEVIKSIMKNLYTKFSYDDIFIE